VGQISYLFCKENVAELGLLPTPLCLAALLESQGCQKGRIIHCHLQFATTSDTELSKLMECVGGAITIQSDILSETLAALLSRNTKSHKIDSR